MKKYFFITILITIVTNAQDSTNFDPYQFFPVNVGNRWEYTRAGPDVTYTVIRDSTDMNDSSRVIFYDAWTTYNPIPRRYPLYRMDKNYNVFYDPLHDNSHIYKLDAIVNEWWRETTRTAAKVLGISQAYVFGKLTTIKTIGFYRLAPGDTVINENSILDYWDKLAYGFGLISRENGATQPMLLRGCRINGITYGTVDLKEETQILPSEFVLYQNYPNPFNPSTTISFSLPNYSQVIVKVFDILGREIQEIVNDSFNPGKHSVKFNANNLTSGVYFYRFSSNKTTKTMKMILQK